MGVVHTLLVDLLRGQLVLLAQEVPDHGGEDVATGAARAASGMLGGTGEVVVIVVKGDLASSGGNCGGGEAVSVGGCSSGLDGNGYYLRCPTPPLPP